MVFSDISWGNVANGTGVTDLGAKWLRDVLITCASCQVYFYLCLHTTTLTSCPLDRPIPPPKSGERGLLRRERVMTHGTWMVQGTEKRGGHIPQKKSSPIHVSLWDVSFMDFCMVRTCWYMFFMEICHDCDSELLPPHPKYFGKFLLQSILEYGLPRVKVYCTTLIDLFLV